MTPRRPSVAKIILNLEQEELWESLHALYSLISERLAKALAPYELTIVEYRALRFCSGAPVRATDLTRSLGLTPSGGTELIDRLERRGFVKRAKNVMDRRSVLVGLTPAGWKRVEVARLARQTYLRSLARSVPPRRQAELRAELAALRATVERVPPP